MLQTQTNTSADWFKNEPRETALPSPLRRPGRYARLCGAPGRLSRVTQTPAATQELLSGALRQPDLWHSQETRLMRVGHDFVFLNSGLFFRDVLSLSISLFFLLFYVSIYYLCIYQVVVFVFILFVSFTLLLYVSILFVYLFVGLVYFSSFLSLSIFFFYLSINQSIICGTIC